MIEATPQHLLDCVALVYDDLLKRPDFVLKALVNDGSSVESGSSTEVENLITRPSNHLRITRITPELTPSIEASTPHQRENVWTERFLRCTKHTYYMDLRALG
ncbi:hypothetical protein AVEN_108857-1 [Araneus ventricosus]|uniref:Uncharacterized protein n=1 Tax=Araneus ventricosus TaxID=182803 RepID=A0A4Y2RSG9_ARAVE|nr:hypothetical protein AVEN_108857-1 [Araneus ventricosus]